MATELRRLALHAVATSLPVVGAILSLAAALWLAWLATRGTDLNRWLFAALDWGEPTPSESFKKLVYAFFLAIWTAFLGLWFAQLLRRRSVIRAIAAQTLHPRSALLFAAFSCLPLALVPALLAIGVEPNNYYAHGPLFFRDWVPFQLFLTAPARFLGASLLLAAAWWLSVKRGAGRRFVEPLAFLLFCETVCLMSLRIGLFPPPDGFVTDFDSHHKSAVLEPLARYFIDGQPTFSQYGGYYVFGGTFVRLAANLGAEPFAATQWFFILCLACAFGSFGLSLRLGSGSWLPAFLALAGAITFAAIPYRGFLYLQVEPLRWLFPSLTMLAFTLLSPSLAARRPKAAIPLFALAFAALNWNLETGIATALALTAATPFLASPRTLSQAIRLTCYGLAGLALGWLAGHGLSLASAALWPHAQLAAPPSGSTLTMFLKGMFVSEAPLFHAWLPMGLGAVWLISFGATRLSLPPPAANAPMEPRLLGLLIFNGALFLLLLIYYVHLSVPSTLAAISYPFFAASALAAHSALKRLHAPAGARLAPFLLPAITAAAPLLFLTPLLPHNASQGGHAPALASAHKLEVTRKACTLVQGPEHHGEVLYLGQNDWWYELICGQVFNPGLAPQSLMLLEAFNKDWKQRLSQATAVFIEADILEPNAPDHGRYGARLAEYREILAREFPHSTSIADWQGKRLTLFIRHKLDSVQP